MVKENIKRSPIFIIGCPRSGNTLLGCILNKHPDLLILFELNIFSNLYRKWEYSKSLSTFDHNYIELFYSIINSTKALAYYNQKYSITISDLSEKLNNNNQWDDILNMYMNILMNRAKPNAFTWGDKTPYNLWALNQLYKEFPNAKVIYTFRDPRNVTGSLSKKSFPWAMDNQLINSEIVNCYLNEYEKQKEEVLKNNILEICYEDLVSEPEKELNKICNYLEIEYLPILLEPADKDIIEVIGNIDYKGWDEVKPQKINLSNKYPDLIEINLQRWIQKLGYKNSNVDNKIQKIVFIHFRLIPYRLIKKINEYFWLKKYPNYPYLLDFYPDYKQYIRWIKNEILSIFKT